MVSVKEEGLLNCPLKQMLRQVICDIKIRWAPKTRCVSIDFNPIVTKIAKIKSLSAVIGDKSKQLHVIRKHVKFAIYSNVLMIIVKLISV